MTRTLHGLCARMSEDVLWRDVLQAIADGVESPAALAKLALTSQKASAINTTATSTMGAQRKMRAARGGL